MAYSSRSTHQFTLTGKYDYATIHSLVDASPLLHISFNDPTHPFPVTLPMIGCTGNFSDPDGPRTTTPQDIYLHGHISSRLFQSAERSSPSGLAITIAASLLDGLVLALSPFHNSCNYRTAILHGYASLLTAPEEKLFALRKISDNLLPSRWENSRLPPSSAELASTGVIKVRIESASAKTRTGGPSEDRNDLRDLGLRARVWTGVLPYWGTWGEPVPAEGNMCDEVEGYIEGWRVGENARGRVGAFEAAGGGGG